VPIYDYVCEKDGEFEDFKSISERESALCPTCGAACNLKSVQGTNQFAAKTKYILPPMATRKFGDDSPSPHRRKRWT
jgi:putative FmdB family regulatory protein